MLRTFSWQQKGKDIDHVGSFSHVSDEVGTGVAQQGFDPYEANFFRISHTPMKVDIEFAVGCWGW